MELTIKLNDDEIKFLKMFAQNQYDGAKDNIGTRDAIHVVERRHRCFVYEEHGSVWIDRDNDYTAYNSFDELIKARIDLGEKLPLYDTVEYETINNIWIDSPEEYCRAFNVTASPGRYIDSYHPVAFFFVLEEAKRYKDDYQSHNCNDCRIYTYSLGYANSGDMPAFRKLLLNMGSMLNNMEALQNNE